jgi:hypothetical protein
MCARRGSWFRLARDDAPPKNPGAYCDWFIVPAVGRLATCAEGNECGATRAVELATDIAAGRADVETRVAVLGEPGGRFRDPFALDCAEAVEFARQQPAKTKGNAKSDRMIDLHAEGACGRLQAPTADARTVPHSPPNRQSRLCNLRRNSLKCEDASDRLARLTAVRCNH